MKSRKIIVRTRIVSKSINLYDCNIYLVWILFVVVTVCQLLSLVQCIGFSLGNNSLFPIFCS